MHRAVALYKLKDLDGALTGVKEAVKLDRNTSASGRSTYSAGFWKPKAMPCRDPRAHGSISQTGLGSGRRRLGPGTSGEPGQTNRRFRSGARPQRALSGDADASDFHRLPSQYRLLPGVPGKIGSTEPCCRRRPFKSSHVCEHFLRSQFVTIKTASRAYSPPKCRAILREPCADQGCQSSGIKAACISLLVPMVTWTIGLFACILLGLQL